MEEGCAYLREGHFPQICTEVPSGLVATTLVVNQGALLSLSQNWGKWPSGQMEPGIYLSLEFASMMEKLWELIHPGDLKQSYQLLL